MRSLVEIFAIVGIVALELKALVVGVDGKVLAIAVSLVAGIGGFELGDFTGRKRCQRN